MSEQLGITVAGKRVWLRVGDHIEHHPSGDYLGVITRIDENFVRFDGPRTRDGYPVTFASIGEVRPARGIKR